MIDRFMKKFGYEKTEENKYGVYYKKREPQNYNHIVCIVYKKNGGHIMQSYDEELIQVPGRSWAVNDAAGVEIPVLLLMWLKAKHLSLKYNWRL